MLSGTQICSLTSAIVPCISKVLNYSIIHFHFWQRTYLRVSCNWFFLQVLLESQLWWMGKLLLFWSTCTFTPLVWPKENMELLFYSVYISNFLPSSELALSVSTFSHHVRCNSVLSLIFSIVFQPIWCPHVIGCVVGLPQRVCQGSFREHQVLRRGELWNIWDPQLCVNIFSNRVLSNSAR